MKADVSGKRVAAFAKRLLQVATAAGANWAAGALFLLSEVLKAQPALWPAIQQPEEVDGGPEDLRDLNSDGSPSDDDDDHAPSKKSKHHGAAGRQRHQVSSAEGPAGSSGRPHRRHDAPAWPKPDYYDMHKRCALCSIKYFPNQKDFGEDNRTTEVDSCCLAAALFIFQTNALCWTEPHLVAMARKASSRPSRPSFAAFFVHGVFSAPLATPARFVTCREPLYCGAERSCLWELSGLAAHLHPTVAAFARTLLSGSTIVYDGDPLKDHSLIAFLDKFVSKKPKGAALGLALCGRQHWFLLCCYAVGV